MMNLKVLSIFVVFCTAIMFCCSCGSNPNEGKETYIKDTAKSSTRTLLLDTIIKLPNVKGGFDLMAVDIKGQRLFLSAEDNHTVEVIDIKNARQLSTLPGFNEPKWIVYRPESNRIYVSTGDGKVKVLDATTYEAIKSFSFREKSNNLRFDSVSQLLYVGVGNTFGALAMIDTKTDKVIAEIPLSDFPKQFELDGNLAYVNIPSKNRIDVVDVRQQKLATSWPVTLSTENVPLALDKAHKRLFVACAPGKLLVYNTGTGKPVAALTIGKDADGIYYDGKLSLLYVSCGEGRIDVVQQKSIDEYVLLDTIPTVKGAATSLFSSQLGRLFLAVPQGIGHTAELRIYEPVNRAR